MFFFFDDQNNTVSNMAFGTFVISVLRDYLHDQGKQIRVGSSIDYYDAFLPDGIDEISGPVCLEIKNGFSNKSAYFRSIENYTRRLDENEEVALLLILGDEFTDNSKNSMIQLAQSKSKRQVFVWDITEFNKRTCKYQQKYNDYIERPTKTIVEEVINKPTSEEQFRNSKEALISELKKKYQSEEIALFLGAGVSSDAGVPQWNELVNALLSEMILRRAKGQPDALLSEHLSEIINLAYKNKEDSPITQMRYIRGAFSTSEYYNLVHDVLYKNNPRTNTELLNEIAKMCTPRRNHIGVQGVVTYNFDDLLERRLERQNVLTNIISSEDDITDSGKLSIFHVHGFLPHRASEINSRVELIFSEEDYHRVYRDAYCWSNLAQLNFLRERTCLFIGCSLTDPNLRRLLDVATRNNEKPRHYAFLRRNHHFDANNVNSDALNAYKSIDMNLREKYYSTMGLNIIWIEKYDEIPQILKSFLT